MPPVPDQYLDPSVQSSSLGLFPADNRFRALFRKDYGSSSSCWGWLKEEVGVGENRNLLRVNCGPGHGDAHQVISALRRLRQEDCEFEASLSYIASFEATQGLHSDSKN
jgi:hypothetical protein